MSFEYQAQAVPEKPGVYLYRDGSGKVLYVGKAVDLRARTRSYFQDPGRLNPKTRLLVADIASMETLVTLSELEALILEQNLIKRFKPRYNILLRDDKSYPYLLLTEETFPRLVVTRRPLHVKGRLYGPFVDAGSMRVAQRLAQQKLGIRPCDLDLSRKLERPCLYHSIGQCGAPCVAGGESPEAYATHVREARALLEGRDSELVASLKERMRLAGEALEYEAAARHRDALQAISVVRARQRVVLPEPRDMDVVAMAFRGRVDESGAAGRLEACVQAFFIRGGKLTERQSYRLSNLEGSDPGEVLAAFVTQWYGAGAPVPEEVVLQHPVDEPAVLQAWLSERRGDRVTLTIPKRGEKLALVRMVELNAQELWESEARQAAAREKSAALAPARDIAGALDELAKVFGLPAPPRRIEGFDISHIQGSHTVASLVVALDGRAARGEYRRFKIKTVKGVDDFASMREVVGRRYKRRLEEGGELPDLIMIDGGKGQLGAALAALKGLGLERLPVFGLAKRLEEFFVPGREGSILLPAAAPGRLLVQRLRDEAHRFAVSYHRQLRAKAISQSELDEIPGLGPALKKRLLARFGGLQQIRQAGPEQLAEVKGLGPALAERIHQALRQDPSEGGPKGG